MVLPNGYLIISNKYRPSHTTHRLISLFLALICYVVYCESIVLHQPNAPPLGFYHRGALFGPAARDGNVTGSMSFAHMTLPPHLQGLCSFDSQPLLNRSVVIVERGNCSFADKALNAQRMGALAMVVADPALGGDALLTMSAGTEGGSVRIPCVFISSNSYNYLRSLTGVPTSADLPAAEIRLLAMHLRDPSLGPYTPIRQRILATDARLEVSSVGEVSNPELDLRGVGLALIIVPAIMCLCMAAMRIRRFLRERVNQEMRVDVSATLPLAKFWREKILPGDPDYVQQGSSSSGGGVSSSSSSSSSNIGASNGDIEGTVNVKNRDQLQTDGQIQSRPICVLVDAHNYERHLQSYAEESDSKMRESRQRESMERARQMIREANHRDEVRRERSRGNSRNNRDSERSSGRNRDRVNIQSNGGGSVSEHSNRSNVDDRGQFVVLSPMTGRSSSSVNVNESGDGQPNSNDSYAVDIRLGWDNGKAVIPGEMNSEGDVVLNSKDQGDIQKGEQKDETKMVSSYSSGDSSIHIRDHTGSGNSSSLNSSGINIDNQSDVAVDIVTSPTTFPPPPRGLRIPLHNDACTICLDDFVIGTDIKVLPCRHGFHPDCIDPWLAQKSDLCPVCKASILEGLENARWERAGCCLRFKRCITCESCTRRVVRDNPR